MPEGHSPLGGSGAYRWMVCPGSVTHSRGIEDPESEDAALGTAAHLLGEDCLVKDYDPWHRIGQWVWQGDSFIVNPTGEPCDIDGSVVVIDKEMTDAVQFYLSEVQRWHPERNQGNSWIERQFHCPDFHKLYWGKSDFTHYADGALDVWDYKHGAGIVVGAERNPQGMYYAAGMLEHLMLWDEVETIRIHIVQPRAWHHDGPHRIWECDPDYLDAWLFDELIPAMKRTEVSRDTRTGEHCRFCPARQAQCPALMSDMVDLEGLLLAAQDDGVEKLTNAQLGRLLELQPLFKIVMKAALKTTYAKLQLDSESVPRAKLVRARTNRQFKEGAEQAASKAFGTDAYEPEKLKSPAQIDALPGGKQFTAEWAYKPDGGFTVALDTDARKPVKRDVKSLFKPVQKGK